MTPLCCPRKNRRAYSRITELFLGTGRTGNNSLQGPLGLQNVLCHQLRAPVDVLQAGGGEAPAFAFEAGHGGSFRGGREGVSAA